MFFFFCEDTHFTSTAKQMKPMSGWQYIQDTIKPCYFCSLNF